MKRPFTLLLGCLLFPGFTFAQGVGIGTTTPDPAAALDITATGKGLLVPRMDSTTRVGIASPPTGLMVYQTNPRAGFYYYTGAAWVFIPDKARSGDNLGNHLATQSLVLNGNQLRLRTPTDSYHVVQYGSTYDGPLLYGYGGGALGYTSDGSTVTPALRWTRNNNVSVDLAGTNAGTAPDLSFGGAGYGEGIGSARATGSSNLYGLDLYTGGLKRLTIGNGGTVSVGVAGTNTGTSPDLAFGGSGTGEGIGSARSSGNPNQYGIDFYTGFTKRLSITNAGYVGIGTSAPGVPLDVNGSIWSRGTVRVDANDTNTGGLTNNAALYFGTSGSNEGIASKRTSGGNQYGLDLYTNNTVRVSVTNAGNFGIGTSAPATKLDVAGNLRLAVRLCPVNQSTYTLTAADIAYSVFKLQNNSFAYTITLPDASAGQVEGQTLTIISMATNSFTISNANTDGTVSMASITNGGVHSATFTWMVDGTGYVASRWVRTQ